MEIWGFRKLSPAETSTNIISIRPAIAADQATITSIVRKVGINRSGLDWQRFLVAETDGQIVGIGQIKPHPECRELASIGMLPEWQRQGIASRIIRELLAKESGPLYLMCLHHNEPFYLRFGFRRIKTNDMPPYFRKINRFMKVFTPVSYLFMKGGAHPRIMKRD